MNLFSVPMAVQCGATITVHAWPYRVFVARYRDLRAVLDALAPDAPDTVAAGLLERVIDASVTDPADRAVLAAADVGPLLEVIVALNRLATMAAKPLSLRTHLAQADTNSQVPGPMTTSLN